MLTQAPKGTSDILPSQSGKWQYLEGLFRDICGRYGMKEIRTPMFEHTELFVRGVGDTTDVVEKQMYSFDDLGGRNLTLKPEGTSPAARAFVQNGLFKEMQPTKMYYITPCFRYEKMQKGRYRQFHQFGTEIFGTESPVADAEIVSVAADMLEAVGMKEVELRINSVGCPVCRAKHREALKAFLEPKYGQLCSTCQGRFNKNPMRILDCKDCQKIVEGAPMMIDYLCEECSSHFEEFQSILKDMDIPFIVDPGIVRGLDYYTKTAFEFVSTKGMAQGTVCGGGRYDHLVEQIGGP
ncbi:MAG: histidine--tRNA ligase, partial [Firmicutes bacterium]|nr:histidine--tRNA ligase [Bacillota bacterium]